MHDLIENHESIIRCGKGVDILRLSGCYTVPTARELPETVEVFSWQRVQDTVLGRGTSYWVEKCYRGE